MRHTANTITIFGLLTGLTSITVNTLGYPFIAALLILLTALLDSLDGPIARKLRQTSLIGENLDFLLDFTAFVVSPSLLLIRIAHDANLLRNDLVGIIVVIAAICAIVFGSIRLSIVKGLDRKNVEDMYSKPSSLIERFYSFFFYFFAPLGLWCLFFFIIHETSLAIIAGALTILALKVVLWKQKHPVEVLQTEGFIGFPVTVFGCGVALVFLSLFPIADRVTFIAFLGLFLVFMGLMLVREFSRKKPFQFLMTVPLGLVILSATFFPSRIIWLMILSLFGVYILMAQRVARGTAHS